MRNWVLVLALANLGVLAVSAWVVDEPAPAPEYDGPGITLLRETDPSAPLARSVLAVTERDEPADPESIEPVSEVPDSEEPAVADPIVVSGSEFGRCVSIGPFVAVAAAESAMETLVDAGFEPTHSAREDDVWDGYWVFIEQIEDVATARQIQGELAENGVEDTQIVSTSDNGTVLSLGVFSEITRAGSQAERVSRVGYEATIEDNLTTTETQWLDVTLTSEQSLALDLLQAPGQISRLELLDCAPDEPDEADDFDEADEPDGPDEGD